jgi:hypothetical protein
MASDGHTYEKSSIETWIRTRKAIYPDGPILSPLTGVPLANENLIPNLTLKAVLSEIVEYMPLEGSSSPISIAQIYNKAMPEDGTAGAIQPLKTSYGVLSSQFFTDLDDLLKMEQFRNMNLQTPQVVAVGDEKTGK